MLVFFVSVHVSNMNKTVISIIIYFQKNEQGTLVQDINISTMILLCFEAVGQQGETKLVKLALFIHTYFTVV